MKEFAQDTAVSPMDDDRSKRPTKMDRKTVERTSKRESHDLIRDNLRRVYGEIAAEPIPPTLVDLLKKLDDPDADA